MVDWQWIDSSHGVDGRRGAAIKVKSAQYVFGYAVVTGKAAPGAAYLLGRRPRGDGRFDGRLRVRRHHAVDCVGSLSDGTTTVDVIVKVPKQAICRPASPVPQTGQTNTFTPGDDGDIGVGVTLPTPRFTDNGDGTITDNLTALMWLKNANCAGLPATSQQNAILDGRSSSTRRAR